MSQSLTLDENRKLFAASDAGRVLQELVAASDRYGSGAAVAEARLTGRNQSGTTGSNHHATVSNLIANRRSPVSRDRLEMAGCCRSRNGENDPNAKSFIPKSGRSAAHFLR